MRKKYKVTGVIVVLLAVLTAAFNYLRHANIQVLNPKGTIAAQEKHLIIIVTLLMLIVVIPVFVLTFFIAWRYRESNTKSKYSPEFDHSVVAETIWWLIPTALIAVISVITWTSSHQLDPFKPISSSKPPITIQVVALDWKWLFIYPQQHIATVNFVQFPNRTPVNFEITADAPMNSFWIPQLGGQIYAMPGMSTELHLMATSTGSFRGSSANISGSGFAGMKFTAKSSSASSFAAWVTSAQHSPANLTLQNYGQLVKPTTDNPVKYYTAYDNNLYASVVLKYMPDTDSLSAEGVQQ